MTLCLPFRLEVHRPCLSHTPHCSSAAAQDAPLPSLPCNNPYATARWKGRERECAEAAAVANEWFHSLHKLSSSSLTIALHAVNTTEMMRLHSKVTHWPSLAAEA